MYKWFNSLDDATQVAIGLGVLSSITGIAGVFLGIIFDRWFQSRGSISLINPNIQLDLRCPEIPGEPWMYQFYVSFSFHLYNKFSNPVPVSINTNTYLCDERKTRLKTLTKQGHKSDDLIVFNLPPYEIIEKIIFDSDNKDPATIEDSEGDYNMVKYLEVRYKIASREYTVEFLPVKKTKLPKDG